MTDYSKKSRNAQAKSGQAMPDGSYPIKNVNDLHNAIRAVGRGRNNSHDAIRRHIIRRAIALGARNAIPSDWAADGSLK